MIKRALLPSAVVVGLLLPQAADAQEFLKDRRYQEGIGVRSGDFEFHPGIAGEVGYDSNWFLRSEKSGANVINAAPNAPVEGAGVLRITPSLSLSTLGPQRLEEGAAAQEPPRVQFRGGLSATYREFIITSDDNLRKQRNVSGAADARVDVNPGRPLGFGIFGNYTRTIQPTVFGNPDLSYNRDDIGVGGEIVTQPNSGTLDWHFGYQLRTELFENSLVGADVTGFDNIHPGARFTLSKNRLSS